MVLYTARFTDNLAAGEMLNFDKARLWRCALAPQIEPDEFSEERERLRAAFLGFRDRAALLAAEIARDLPDYTVHDVTHLDALWHLADLIAGPDFMITPTEAFVLGGAILTHDLGNGLAAYPDGVQAMYSSSAWRDAVSLILRKTASRAPTEEEILSAPQDVKTEATSQLLRMLHAQQAERLALVSWKDPDSGTQRFLIEDIFLRETYGRLIGRIAHSHWWSVDRLKPEFDNVIGAPSFCPQTWTVDPLKISCLLRVADAAHLDPKRAPSFLKTIRKPTEASRKHWVFQERLQQPILKDDRLIFTSGQPFGSAEAPAWWLCFEALQALDRELVGSDSVLSDCLRSRFVARGVQGAEDASRLCRWVQTDGWVPVDSKVRVSDVAELASRLGGAQLYGRDNLVPLRELIQNASDAVRARRCLEKRPLEFGDIVVRIGTDQGGSWIEVTDNGIGMSPRVLTGPLLDFGSPFWNSELVMAELPGLSSSMFVSTGKYGIGFFSLFMWGEHVRVTSRSYRDAPRDTHVLEFSKGIHARPMLRDATAGEFMSEAGTVVRVWAKSPPESPNGVFSSPHEGRRKLEYICRWLCPALDVDLYAQREGRSRTLIIKASDWTTISGKKLLDRVFEDHGWEERPGWSRALRQMLAAHLRTIADQSGEIVARAAILPEDEYGYPFGFGAISVGGLRSCGLGGIAGILQGLSTTASRDYAIPTAVGARLSEWATTQAVLLSGLTVAPAALASAAEIVRRCGGDTGPLPIANSAQGWLTAKGVQDFASVTNEILLVGGVFLRGIEQDLGTLELLPNVLTCTSGRRAIISTRLDNADTEWPDPLNLSYEKFMDRSNEAAILRLAATAWAASVKQVLGVSDITTDRKSYSRPVAIAGGRTLERPVQVLRNPRTIA